MALRAAQMKVFTPNTYTWLGLCWLVLVVACSPSFREIQLTDVPVQALDSNTKSVNTDIVLTAVTQKVHETLPSAYYRGMVFAGRCEDLSQLRGKLVLIFLQTQWGFPKQRAFRAVASVDTIQQKMNLRYTDETNYYPATEQQTFAGDQSVKIIFALAHQHIAQQQIPDCDVTVTELDDVWHVRCGPLENFIKKCEFEITKEGIINEIK
jgi:hypothetical protein